MVRPFLAAIAIIIAAAIAASAAEPRPWLCRDKPAFSSDTRMTYDVTVRGARRWRLLLMQFQPNAAHDGFDIVQSRELNSRTRQTSGSVSSGRYFAVAMYLESNGHWICSQAADSGSDAPAGALASLCYSDDDTGACGLTLTVRRAPPS